jgi:hypothetical protein
LRPKGVSDAQRVNIPVQPKTDKETKSGRRRLYTAYLMDMIRPKA